VCPSHDGTEIVALFALDDCKNAYRQNIELERIRAQRDHIEMERGKKRKRNLDLPRITYHASDRTFERLFKGTVIH
jgi:hypothetical protein